LFARRASSGNVVILFTTGALCSVHCLSNSNQAVGFIEVAVRTDYVNGTDFSPVAFLEGIYVVPEARRRGTARALVAAAERWAINKGCREFASDAAIENELSHTMHRALGFEETKRAVFFRKALAKQ
jgi:aminoglycoside 6'-N-acetyltransferase I